MKKIEHAQDNNAESARVNLGTYAVRRALGAGVELSGHAKRAGVYVAESMLKKGAGEPYKWGDSEPDTVFRAARTLGNPTSPHFADNVRAMGERFTTPQPTEPSVTPESQVPEAQNLPEVIDIRDRK